MKRGVLYISHSPENSRVLSAMLAAVSIPLKQAQGLKVATEILDSETFGLILTEAQLADGKWEDIMDLVKRTHPHAEVVVTDRLADARLWADALNEGAYDVLAQPFYSGEVQRVVTNALSVPARLSAKRELGSALGLAAPVTLPA